MENISVFFYIIYGIYFHCIFITTTSSLFRSLFSKLLPKGGLPFYTRCYRVSGIESFVQVERVIIFKTEIKKCSRIYFYKRMTYLSITYRKSYKANIQREREREGGGGGAEHQRETERESE